MRRASHTRMSKDSEIERTHHTFKPRWDSAFAEEIERRVTAFDRREMSAWPAEDVFAEARRLRSLIPSSDCQ